MFSIFKRDPAKKLKKLYFAKLEQAMFAQRNGDIKTYSELTAEADEIDKQISNLNNSPS
ncbi:hypothetical protein TUM4438_14710 [Shewanella sairae]|uniref:Lacal_2735 family protein n=1 Tax=Shewanella sairae TaxID=190310 RepID=A0ABQ4P9D8_9GAMM|nr:DUF6435 family protein [Shewanella sairae]MCL1129002.1 DUF6435 family protein [Shewanella sairae]GIU44152.1 hypothetical protein TUM4438_14710 [Shewanella sairae]